LNADNGGNGISNNSGALFGYSNLLGTDEAFNPAEKTGARTIQFRDSASEMFTFEAVITGYHRRGSTPATSSGGSGGEGSPDSDSALPDLTELIRFTVNPLTRVVTAQLIQ
jgi:hypothetical protein